MTDRLRILLLSQAPGVGGGERSVIAALARAENLHVTVAAHRPVCEFAEQCGLEAIELVLPRAQRLVDVLRLPVSGMRVRRLAKSLGTDVLYANGIRAIVPGVAARALRGPPLLVHHHGQFGSGPLRPYVAGIRRWADAIVTDSEWSARPFGPTPKLAVVPNGIDVEHFRPPEDREEAKARLDLPPDAPVVGMLARAHPGKGAAAFVAVATRVARRIPAASFLLAGGPTFPDEAEHYDRVRESTVVLGKRVKLTGYIADTRLAYEAMDVFVYLGEPEGLSLSVLEAFACGLVVVAYRWGAIGEVVAEGTTGVLVRPNDVDAASSVVAELLADEALRERIAFTARAECVERYGVDQFTRKLTDLLVAVRFGL